MSAPRSLFDTPFETAAQPVSLLSRADAEAIARRALAGSPAAGAAAPGAS